MFDLPAESTEGQQRIHVHLDAIDGNELRVDVGRQHLIAQGLDRQRRHVNGATLVQADLLGGGTILLARVGKTMTGVIRLGTVGFEIAPAPGGHVLIPRNWKNPRPLHDDDTAPRGPAPPKAPTSNETAEVTVLFAYTKMVLDKLVTVDAIRGLIIAAMAQIETACSAANVNVSFKVVPVDPDDKNHPILPQAIDGKEGTRTISQIYDALYDHVEFNGAHDARKKFHADVLVLLVDRGKGGLGKGTIMGELATAFAVVDHNDALWYMTVAHEVGHVMGGLHDDDWKDEPRTYSHAFQGADTRTILSKACTPPENCTLLDRWSQPPDLGDSYWRDFAQVLRETAPIIAKFGEQL